MAHLDEGTIHAWLDDALPAEEAARVEAHVAVCAECSAAVAEARGLIAASSRIVGALDGVPGGVVPTSMQAVPGATGAGAPRERARRSRWTGWPLRAAAAVLLMAGGAMVVLRDGRVQDEVRFAPVSDQASDQTADQVVGAAGGTAEARQPAEQPAEQPAAPTPLAGTSEPREETATAAAAAPVAPPAPAPVAPSPTVTNAPAVVGAARPPAAKRIEAPAPPPPRPQAYDTPPTATAAPNLVLRGPSSSYRSDSARAVEGLQGRAAAQRRVMAAEADAQAEVRERESRMAGSAADRAKAASAAVGEVRGVVRSPEGRPLPGVMVRVQGTALAATVEADGRFVLSDVPAGARQLQVRGVGFEPATVAVTVRPDSATDLEVALTPGTLALNDVTVTGSAARTAAGCYVLAPATEGLTPAPGAPPATPPDTLVLLGEPMEGADGWSRARVVPADPTARWRQDDGGAIEVTWNAGRMRLPLLDTLEDRTRVGRWTPAGGASREVRARRVECPRE